MPNSAMLPGRFLRLYRGRKLYRQIQTTLAASLRVQHTTYTRSTVYTAKHAGMIRLAPNGDILVQRGKRWDCVINHAGFRFEREVA